jgi:hypothetical protein
LCPRLVLCVTIGLIILQGVVNRLTELVVLEIALNLYIKKQSSYKPFQGLRLKECELALLCCFPLKNYDAGRKRLERSAFLLSLPLRFRDNKPRTNQS